MNKSNFTFDFEIMLPYYCFLLGWWQKPASVASSWSPFRVSVAVIGQIMDFFFLRTFAQWSITDAVNYWYGPEGWSEKGTYGALKDEDNEVFWRVWTCNQPECFVFSDNLRADTMPFFYHSHTVSVGMSVFSHPGQVWIIGDSYNTLQRERLQFNLGSHDVVPFPKLNILHMFPFYVME